jgi:peroxiredoxin
MKRNFIYVFILFLILNVQLNAMAKRPSLKEEKPKASTLTQKIGVNEYDYALDFTLPDLNGKNITISDYKGKTNVLLVFFATWCPPCIREIPELNRISSEISKDELRIIAVNVEGKDVLSKLRGFSKKHNIVYDVVIDTEREISRKYNILGIPTNILVDRDGVIRYRGHGLPENLH